jgi:ABC-type branched-subunit amino acid transport system permease subunit
MSLASAVVVFAVVYRSLRSRHGLALTAIRDSGAALASLGVNTSYPVGRRLALAPQEKA